MKCDQPESHARIAVFGHPNATVQDTAEGRACEYGMVHETTVFPPADPASQEES